MNIVKFRQKIDSIRAGGKTSAEIAIMCNINASYFSQIYNGKQEPSLNTLRKLCKGLNATIEDFIDMDVEN